jgi:hypothetical protein
MIIKKRWLFLLSLFTFTVPLFGQVSNPAVRYVATAPSGACAQAPPVQVANATGDIYTCDNGTWKNVTNGGGGGTVTSVSGTTNQIDVTGTTAPVVSLDNAVLSQLPGAGVFNVVAYGAKCDGATNDTTAFQSTVTAASNYINTLVAGGSAGTINVSGTTATWVSGAQFSAAFVGAIIYLPGLATNTYQITAVASATSLTLNTSPGTLTGQAYNLGLQANVELPAAKCVTNTVTGAEGVIFKGQGKLSTTWSLISNTNGNLVTIPQNVAQYGFEDMTLDGNGSNQSAGDVIHATDNSVYPGLSFAIFNHVRVFNPYNHGFYMGTSTARQMANDIDIQFDPQVGSRTWGNECIFTATYDSKWQNVECGFAGTNGIEISGTNNQFTTIKVYASGAGATQVGFFGIRVGEGTPNSGNFTQISNLELQDNYAQGIGFFAHDNLCMNCMIQNNGRYQGSSACGINFNNSSYAYNNVVTMSAPAQSDQTTLQAYAICGLSSATGNTIIGSTQGNLDGIINGTYAGNNLWIRDASGTTINQFTGSLQVDGIVNTATPSSTNPICPNGAGGAYTTSGCVQPSTGAITAVTASIGGSALTAGQCASGTATATGALTTMAASASPNTYPGAGFSWTAQVTSANTVTVYVCAIAAGTPTASTYNVALGPGITLSGNDNVAASATSGVTTATALTPLLADGSGNIEPGVIATYYISPLQGSTGLQLANTANRIYGYGFVPESTVSFSAIYSVSQTADASGLYSMAIANSSGTLICHPTTGINVPTANSMMTNTCSEGTVTIQAGKVYILLTTGNASAVGKVYSLSDYVSGPYNSGNVTGCTSSAGVLSGTCSITLSQAWYSSGIPGFSLH